MIDQGVNSYRIGYATAVAVILFAICFVFSILYQFFVLRRDVAGGSTRMAAMSGEPPAERSRSAAPLRERACLRRRARARGGRDRADRLRRARRLPHDRPDRRRPGRAARSVGDGTTTCTSLTSGTFWRELGNSMIVAAIATFARRDRQLDGRVPALAHASSAAARRSTRSSRSGSCSRSPSRRCPSTSCCASSACSSRCSASRSPRPRSRIPLTIIILRPFMRAIPGELEDAAAMDGCGRFGFFWRVLIPLCRPR